MKDEDLGDGYRVEPTLDPAPNGGEEGWRADDLGALAQGNTLGLTEVAYEDPVQGFRVMGRGKNTGILHVVLQIPKLAQADALNIDNVRGIRDWHFGTRPLEGGT